MAAGQYCSEPAPPAGTLQLIYELQVGSQGLVKSFWGSVEQKVAKLMGQLAMFV